MGRPRGEEETRIVSIRLPVSVYEELHRRARGRPVGTYLREQLSKLTASSSGSGSQN